MRFKIILMSAAIISGLSTTANEMTHEEKMAEMDREPLTVVTGKTIFMKNVPDATSVTTLNEGVWGMLFDYNKYKFFRIDGKEVTDTVWTDGSSNRSPKMTKWGLLMKMAGDSKSPLYLIMPDGNYKTAPANYESPSNFVDGVAIVGVRSGYSIKYKYIGHDLKVIWQDLNPSGSSTIAPVSEGLRPYKTRDAKGYDVWGFIDESGKVVIEPQFLDARGFHCGRAWVRDKQGKYYFIDRLGKKAFEPGWKESDGMYISDYCENMCSGPGEKYNLTNYYDIHGTKVATLTNGTPFQSPLPGKPGEAFYKYDDKENNKQYVYKVNSGFGIGSDTGISTSNLNTPVYDDFGFAHFTSTVILDGPCNDMYFGDYRIGKFSKDGFAPAFLNSRKDNASYTGFIDTKGEFVLVYRHTQK